ncbi:membrane protein [Vibrio harveyi]|nr:membrane protein [Vibrio harveyi]
MLIHLQVGKVPDLDIRTARWNTLVVIIIMFWSFVLHHDDLFMLVFMFMFMFMVMMTVFIMMMLWMRGNISAEHS